jgi:hypothetical protein
MSRMILAEISLDTFRTHHSCGTAAVGWPTAAVRDPTAAAMSRQEIEKLPALHPILSVEARCLDVLGPDCKAIQRFAPIRSGQLCASNLKTFPLRCYQCIFIYNRIAHTP